MRGEKAYEYKRCCWMWREEEERKRRRMGSIKDDLIESEGLSGDETQVIYFLP